MMKTLIKILGVILVLVGIVSFNSDWMLAIGCFVIGGSFLNVR